MTLPRVVVIGSCVSRDPFSRRFFPAYQERAQLVFDAYQLAVPSLVRAASVDARLPEVVRVKHRRYIEQEMIGGVLDGIIAAKPDVIIIDFYADVHFGVTTIDRCLVTRNHMAFPSTEAATAFYQDEGQKLPSRGRFDTGDAAGNGYRLLFEAALAVFLERLKADLPQAALIVNSARFSLDYRDQDGTTVRFPKAGRFAQKKHFLGGCRRSVSAHDGLPAADVPEIRARRFGFPPLGSSPRALLPRVLPVLLGSAGRRSRSVRGIIVCEAGVGLNV